MVSVGLLIEYSLEHSLAVFMYVVAGLHIAKIGLFAIDDSRIFQECIFAFTFVLTDERADGRGSVAWMEVFEHAWLFARFYSQT